MKIEELCYAGLQLFKDKIEFAKNEKAICVNSRNDLFSTYGEDEPLLKDYDGYIKGWEETIAFNQQRIEDAEILIHSL